MSNQQDSSSKGLVTIIVALIGVLGTVAVAYFAFRGNIEPRQLEIHATQTAESIRATQIAAAPIQAGLTSSPTDNPVPTPTLYTPPPTVYVPPTIPPTVYISPTIPPTVVPFTAIPPTVALPTAAIKTYKNVATGLCLDSNLQGAVYTLGCNGGNYQNWESQDRRLVNVSTGLCLDSNPQGAAYTLGCNGGNYQNWESQDGRLVNVSTGFCLDSNPQGAVYTLGCNDGNYQNWK